MPWRICLAWLIALSTLMPGPSSAEASFQIGAWQARAYSDERTGAFGHCTAHTSPRSGGLVLVSVTGNLKWVIGLTSRDWRLSEGEMYAVAFTVDDLSPLTLTGRAISPVQVMLPLERNAVPMFDRFGKGQQLKIAAAGQMFEFDLGDTNRLLQRLQLCAESRGMPRAAPHKSAGEHKRREPMRIVPD